MKIPHTLPYEGGGAAARPSATARANTHQAGTTRSAPTAVGARQARPNGGRKNAAAWADDIWNGMSSLSGSFATASAMASMAGSRLRRPPFSAAIPGGGPDRDVFSCRDCFPQGPSCGRVPSGRVRVFPVPDAATPPPYGRTVAPAFDGWAFCVSRAPGSAPDRIRKSTRPSGSTCGTGAVSCRRSCLGGRCTC